MIDDTNARLRECDYNEQENKQNHLKLVEYLQRKKELGLKR